MSEIVGYWLSREASALADLKAAEEAYKKASYEIREEIGSELRRIRQVAGLTMAMMGKLTGLNRQSVFTAEEPTSSKRWFSVERLLEIREAYIETIKIVVASKKVSKKKYAPAKKFSLNASRTMSDEVIRARAAEWVESLKKT